MSSREKGLDRDGGSKSEVASAGASSVNLKRELGLFSAVNLILGVMIGSGIFVTPGSALQHSGSVGLCLIIWTVSGIISLLGALSFAELGTVLGQSGAEYSYFREAFGKIHKYWGPLPSFLCAWIYVIILRPAEVAIIIMTFAEYAMQHFISDIVPEYKYMAQKLVSLAALCFRLNNLTKTAQEALSRPKVMHYEIRSEHIQKAKSTFGMLKSELHGVIQSLFPNLSDLIMDIIAQLHQEKNNEESNGYIPITNDTFWIFELLRDMNIVALNPYNKLEVKLAY